MVKDLAIKTSIDVGATLTFTSMLADIGKQFILASVVVFVNVLLYPLLKCLLNALNKKLKLGIKDEEIDKASKDIKNIVEAKINEEKENKK